MPRRDEAMAAMRDALQIQDPELDISPGGPTWKILEAVAQQVENLTFNSVINDFHLDVDKKSGLELDLIMSLFGFARIKARRATGVVTFQRGIAALQDYVIPSGTQVFVPSTVLTPSLFFQTTVSVVLATGDTEVDAPVQAVVAGSTGNVAAYSISGIATAVGGVTSIFNAQAISGGTDAESDDSLKDRWHKTNMRNISGTEDQFLGLAFNESAFVTRANLIGPIERYREQLQLVEPEDLTATIPWEGTLNAGINNSVTTFALTATHGTRFPIALLADSTTWFYAAIYSGTTPTEIIQVKARAAGSDTLATVVRAVGAATHSGGDTIRMVTPSSVTDSKYTYPAGGEIVGINIGSITQSVGRRGTDYNIITDGTIPKPAGTTLPLLTVTPTGAGTFGLGSVLELESEYTPTASRNDPANKIAEKVDLFVDGSDPLNVIEQVPMRQSGFLFGTDYTVTDFFRDDGINHPSIGNYYTPLSKSPIANAPTSITVAATATTPAKTYYKNEDFWIVSATDDVKGLEGSPRGSNGIEWNTPSAAATGTFSATAQSGTGKLNGYYSYVFTYEVDGVESLPHAAVHTDAKNKSANPSAFGKNALLLPTAGGGGAVKWRKIYRTLGNTTSFAAADATSFYLLAVVKDNTTTAYLDNRSDSALNTSITPPKSPPPVDAPLAIEYSYNALIERLDAQVDLVRLVGMDTLVHAADEVQLKFNLAVVLVAGMNASDVKADINTNLFAWVQRKSFQNNIQISDVIDIVSNSPGVDNIRLARASEARNDVQKLTVTPNDPTPDATRDRFTITIGGITSGVIDYNEAAQTVREVLEAMPNIQAGNTYATQIFGTPGSPTTTTTLQVDDNTSLHVDGGAGAVFTNYYIQVGTEIMLVTGAVDAGATQTLTVKRAQLGTSAYSVTDNDDVHILGDVAVSSVTAGTSTVYTISFLPNAYNGDDNWGNRYVDNITASPSSNNSKVSLLVQKKVEGAGYGIQVIAPNDTTIDAVYTDDFYLASDELPSLFGVDIVVKAQNTFS